MLENIQFLLLVCRNLINNKSNLSYQIDKTYNLIQDSSSISYGCQYILLYIFIVLVIVFTPEPVCTDFIHWIQIPGKITSYFEAILLINLAFLGVVIPFITMSYEKVTNIIPSDIARNSIHKFLKTKRLIRELIFFSLLIPLFYLLLEENSLRKAWIIPCFCFYLLIKNSIEMYIFVSKSLKLTDNPILLLKLLVQDYISSQYHKEIKSYMTTNLYINFIASQNLVADDDRVYPSVSLYFHSGDNQRSKVQDVVIQKNFLQLKTLSDINLANLEPVIASWIKRNTMIKNNRGNFLNPPMMTLPLYPNQSYQGTITVCAIQGVAPLSWIEKVVINYCTFKFVKPTDAFSRTSTELLKYYQNIIKKSIEQQEQVLFEEALQELVRVHLILLKYGEVKDKDGKIINLSTISKSYFNDLQKEWVEIYRDVIKNTIEVLPKNDYFFSICSRVFVDRLIPSVLENSSMTSLSNLINMHGYFLYELNKSQKSGRLDFSTYLEALQDFIGIRERIYRTLIDAAESVKWDSFNNLFKGLNEYLISTITSLAQTGLGENKEIADLFIGSLWECREFLHNKVRYDDCYNALKHDKSVQALITPTMLNKSFNEVKQIFPALSMRNIIKERTLFFNILENYWEDSCFILSAFLLFFAQKLNELGNIIDMAKYLIKKKSLDDYLASFIRRHRYHHFNDKEYSAMIDTLARHIDCLTEGKRVLGRVYVTYGNSIDKIFDAEIIIAAIVSGSNFTNENVSDYMESLCKNDLIQNLISKIETILRKINLKAVKTTQLYKEFIEIYDICVKDVRETSIKSKPNSNAGADTYSTGASQLNKSPLLTDKLNLISIIFIALLQSAKEAQSRYVKSLPISQEKLNDIAKKCSAKAFDKNTAYFPVSLFKEVVLLEQRFNKFTLTVSGVNKRQFTEEKSYVIHYDNYNYEPDVSGNIYRYLVLDILDEAKKSKVVEIINVSTKAEYVRKVLEYSELLKKKNLTPILIAEDHSSPEWIDKWSEARWVTNNKLADEQAEIKYDLSLNDQHNYLFHINSIPLYIGMISTEGTLLLPKEILKTLKFSKYDSGNPVNVTFEQNDNMPQEGSLIFTWERMIELDLEYKMYKITYPKSINEE